MVKCREELVIPFMKETRSKILIFDCTNAYHNDEVYELFGQRKLKDYPSAGYGHNVKDGYPPNSHETMPNEQMHNDLKEVVKKRMFEIRKSRRNMTSLPRIIKQSAAEFPKEKANSISRNFLTSHL
jgi:hypothetical protein